MLRKLAIAIAASGAMMSASTIHALGMGDIELDSALNQPLNARIKLLKASELENWEIKPDLASRDEFEKSGVERVFFLNSLKFEVVRDGSNVFVDVSSDQPVVEPFLNFLVQVDWPNGRLLREYTLLLDPPVFEEESMPAEVAAPQEEFSSQDDDLPGMGVTAGADDIADIPDYVESSDDEFVSDSPESEDISDIPDYQEEPVVVEQVTAEETVAEEVDAPEPVQPEVYEVRANDTLWEVAIQTRANRSISPQQAMLAIQDLNPDAFISGNINRLKKNQVLQVPTEQQMLSRSFDEAVADVALQNEAFAQRKAQLDATRKEQAVVRDAESADGKLTLLASGDASTEADRGASGRVDSITAGDQSSIENELNLALENLDKSSRENQELRARLDAMEEQINTLQRLINLKDEQMVALQSGMAAPESMPEEDVQSAMADPASESLEQDLPEDAPESQEVESSKGSSQDLNFQGGNEVEQKPVVTGGSNEAEVGAKAADKPSATPKPKPKFVYEPPVEEEPFDVIAFAIENPQIPGAVLGALLLALLGISRARKKKEEAAQDLPEASEFSGADPLDQIEGDFDDDFDSEFSDLDLGEEAVAEDFDADQFESGEVADAGLPDSLDETEGHESTDVLGEVEVYMAYNRIEPAKALLEKTIAEQPARMELRLKMMEVLSEMDDAEGFAEQFDAVMQKGNGADQAQANDLKAKMSGGVDSDLGGLDSNLDSGLDLDLGAAGDDDLSSLDLGSDDSELDFDLDGLDLDTPSEAVEEVSQGGDLDFDLDLDSSDSLDLDSSDGLDLDAGMELGGEQSDDDLGGLDIDLGAEDSVAEESSLDFDLELDSEGSSDDSGLDFDVPELSNEGDDLDIDLGSDDDFSELSLGSTEEMSLGGEMPELEETSDVELDLGSADADLDIDLGSLEESVDVELDVPSLDDSLATEVDLSFDEDELSLDSVTEDLTELDSDLELPSLEDEVATVEDLPVIDEEPKGGEELPSLDDMDGLEGDLDFLSGTDESETKLDLARAYIDMDDKDGAKEILQEVLEEGTDDQKQEASKLMDSMV